MAVFTFYGLNGFDLDAPEDDAYDVVIGASTGTVAYAAVAEELAGWAKPDVTGPRNPAEFRSDG